MHRAVPRLALGVALATLVSLIGSPALARRGELPTTPAGRGTVGAPELRLQRPDLEALRAEDAAKRVDGDKTFRYADPQSVRVTPDSHGQWDRLVDGTRRWRLEISGDEATDLNLGFTRFHLPHGGKLWVVSAADDYYEGPYTHEDNKDHGQLWVPVVPGGRAIVELQVPAETKTEPELVLTTVGYGYRGLFHRDPSHKQGACNNDVVCPEGDPWRAEIASVGAYSLGGSIFCTGTMVMDVPNSFRPFFLTAQHCGITAGNAASLVVYWNFESPNCGDLCCGSLVDNQTGATWLASRQDVDMCLLELDSPPDPAFGVYWAGWDRSGSVPPGSVAIHHPNGDEKAISFNDDALTTQNSCIAASTNTHWRVDNWEDGTTEPGSSGSGLFHPNSRLLIGFLSGGAASCSNPGGYDCYGKFSVAWDGASSQSRMRDWLDPNGTGPNQVLGSYPTGVGTLLASGTSGTDDCSGTSNGIWEPGEQFSLTVDLQAVGGDLTGISGVLSSAEPDVTIPGAAANWPDLTNSNVAGNLTPFTLDLAPGATCFGDLALTLTVTSNEGGPFVFPVTLPVGLVQSPPGLPVAIPDGDPGGVTSQFTIGDNVVLTDLDVRVEISHTWVGDLRIQLQSPAGTTVTLLDRPGVPASTYGCSDDNLDITFDDSAGTALESFCAGSNPWYNGAGLPSQPLSAFNGESTAGTWTLIVSDNVGQDTGSIVDWELLTTPGIGAGTCDVCDTEPGSVTVTATANAPVSVMNVPNGNGLPLTQALQWDGIPGSIPSVVDASLSVLVETALGNPVVGIPADQFFLVTDQGSLNPCADGNLADGPTDATGTTTFTAPLRAGGSSQPGELTEVGLSFVTGLPDYLPGGGSGLDIRFNSPDISGDLVVDLVDVGDFAVDFFGGYDYRSDLYWDGVLDLKDVSQFSLHVGTACPPAKAPAAATRVTDGSGLGIAFDRAGVRRAAVAEAGDVIEAHLVLTGPLAHRGIRAWEASVRTTDNLQVVDWTLPERSVRMRDGNDFVVGTAMEAGDHTAARVLATARIRVLDDQPAALSLEASSLKSGDGDGPVVVANGSHDLLALPRIEGDAATLNKDDAATDLVITRAWIANVPNPFNPATEIRFALPRGGDTEVRIYDVAGRLVRQLPLGSLDSGIHSVRWNGTDRNGAGVVSGIYFSRLFLDGRPEGDPGKMSLVK